MRSKAILLCCLAVAAVAIFLWSRNRLIDEKPASPAPLLTVSPKPETTPGRQTTAAVPHDWSREKENAVDTSRGSNEGASAAVHAKLRQWLSSKTGDTETQEALTKELLALLTDENTAEIIQALSPEEFGTPFGSGALERWLKVDSIQAARWAAARPDATEEHALLVARRMLEDTAQLHAYCDQLPEGTWKQNVLNHASLEAVSKDPVAAIALAQRMTAGDVQTNALETIAYDWFGRDLPAAANWVKTVEDPQLRERLLAVGAKAIATADPDLAAGWLVSTVKTEGVLNETALSIVETWTDQHPAEAANWVARFSEAGPRKIAIDLVLGHWLKSDPAAANAWIQNLPEREAIFAKLKAEQVERERTPDPE